LPLFANVLNYGEYLHCEPSIYVCTTEAKLMVNPNACGFGLLPRHLNRHLQY